MSWMFLRAFRILECILVSYVDGCLIAWPNELFINKLQYVYVNINTLLTVFTAHA